MQQVWSVVVSKREVLDEDEERMRRPVLDRALEVIYDQALAWLATSQLAHSLALHVALSANDSSGGMTLWLRGLKGERFSASFSDEISLLDLLSGAMEIRGVVRAATQTAAARRPATAL